MKKNLYKQVAATNHYIYNSEENSLTNKLQNYKQRIHNYGIEIDNYKE